MAVKKAISKRKAELMKQSVINCEGDQKKLFSLIHSLLVVKRSVLPEYTSSFTLASSINMFFIEKIHNIKMEFPLLEACLPAYSFVDIDTIMLYELQFLTHYNHFLVMFWRVLLIN